MSSRVEDESSCEYEEDAEIFLDSFIDGQTYEEMEDNSPPSINEDTWIDALDVNETTATIGCATAYAWSQAKEEFESIRKVLENCTGSMRPSLAVLGNLIFGADGELFKTFVTSKIFHANDHKSFLQFLAAFFQSAAYSVHCKQMYATDSRLVSDGVMSEVNYRSIWRLISEEGLPSQRHSFHSTLVSLISDLVSQTRDATPEQQTNSTVTPPRQTRREAAISRIPITNIVTGKTPVRKVALKLDMIKQKAATGIQLTRSESILLNRTTDCSGWPVKRTDDQWGGKRGAGRGTCVFCGSLTQWYCVRCKRFFCNEVNKSNANVDEFATKIQIESVGEEPIFCFGSCYLQGHKDALVASQHDAIQRLSNL